MSKLGVAVVLLAVATSATGHSTPEFRPNEIIVKFAPGVAGVQSIRIAEAYGCRVAGTCPAGNLRLIHVPEAVDPNLMAEAFE